MKKYSISKQGTVFNSRGRQLKVWDSTGYLACHYGLIHRLIALEYIPNPLSKPCVNHKNGDKKDNRLENLEWCTHSENTQHSWYTGLHNRSKHSKSLRGLKKSAEHKRNMSAAAKKRKPNNIKLSLQDKKNIKVLLKTKSQVEIAHKYRVSQATISRVKNES